MQWELLLQATILWLSLCTVQSQRALGEADQCSYWYITQPPQEFPCDPYFTSHYRMRLECNVAGPSPDTSGVLYKLLWYYSPDGNVTVLLEDGFLIDIDIFTHTFSNGLGIRSRLRVRDDDAMLPGYYWCQVAVNDSFVNATATVADFSPLNPSTKTRLRPPDDPMYYGLPPCPPNAYLDNADIQCADLSSQETTATPQITSKPLPTPVLSEDMIPSVHICSNGSNSSAQRKTTIPLESLIAVAVGVPIFVAILILILVVVMTVRKSGREKPETNGSAEFHTVKSTTQLVLSAEDDGISVNSRTSRSTLPPHLSVSRELSSDSQYADIPEQTDRRAAVVVGMLKAACQTDLSPSEMERRQYRSINPSTRELSHVYNTADSQMNDRVMVDENEYCIVDPAAVTTDRAEYTQPAAMTSRPGLHPTLHPTQSDGEYVIPNSQEYQGLDSDKQEYVALYMTPDMQSQQRTVDVGTHQYQLPNSSSIEPIGLYTVPDSSR